MATNKKPRKKYRPPAVRISAISPDPVSYVVNGLQPATTAASALCDIGLKNHGAMTALAKGVATKDDVIILINALNMAMALASMGQGSDWLPELRTAMTALRDAGKRRKFLLTGVELTALNLALEVHDAQLADPKTTVQMLERAASGLRQLAAIGKIVTIDYEGATLC